MYYKVNYKFNASHNFSKDIKGKHPHTFCVDIFIKKNSDEFVEFVDYEKKIENYLMRYKSQYLNDLDEFDGVVPILENMCKRFYDDILHIFSDDTHFNLVRVELGDNPKRSVSVGEDIVINSSNIYISSDKFSLFKKALKQIKS